MKIEFTKEQFESLITLSLTGNIIINSYRDEDEVISKYDDLVGYILSCSKEFGLSGMVSFDKENSEFFPSEETQESVIDFIEEYDSNTFTNDLIESLALRDMIEKYDESEVENMSDEEFEKKKSQFDKIYADEIIENGVNNLYLKK